MVREKQIIECVPNFSEGRDKEVIRQITDEVERVEGVKLLDVDPGEATNRTVVTFVGEPSAVMEAAFRCVKKAAQLIDMRQHHGAHPRMGATDVLPLIPVSGITLEECAALARQLAERIAGELAIATKPLPGHPSARILPYAARESMRHWPNAWTSPPKLPTTEHASGTSRWHGPGVQPSVHVTF